MSATECVTRLTPLKFKIKTGFFRIGIDSGIKPSLATPNVKNSSVESKKHGLSEARDGREEKRQKMDCSVMQQCSLEAKWNGGHPVVQQRQNTNGIVKHLNNSCKSGVQNPTMSVRSEPKKLTSAVEKQNLAKKLSELLREKVSSHLQGLLKKSGIDLQRVEIIEKVIDSLSHEDLWGLKKVLRSGRVVRTAKDCGTKLHPDPQLSKPKIESKGVESALNEDRMSSCHPDSTTDTAAISAEGLNPSGDSELSAQKALRAALLKSRFADTILKAKQKVDKADRVKSQLERQQQEGRAGLQAERKLKGSCNVRAEAERKFQREREAERKLQRERMRAESERKLQRERERKAARLALQQMVKTVEINNDHMILKDLELLSGCSQSDQYSYNIRESSAEVGSEKRGHFSRALEQLGLFMKDDYNDYMEDEDEDRAVLTELEEGEII